MSASWIVQSQSPDPFLEVPNASQDTVNRAGEQIVSRELDIRPTLTIRPGYPVRVLVTRDIIMEQVR